MGDMGNTLQMAFAGIVGLLLLASAVTFALASLNPQRNYVELKLRIVTWWWLVAIFFVALTVNRTIAIVSIAIISFMGFKEFLSLAPTRRADHSMLMLAYLTIPIQYLWVGMSWYGMFIIFIPVYAFLLLPMRMVIVGETQGFLRAAGIVHWGLMTTVFSISHMAYLLVLPPKAGVHGMVTGEMLVFYLLVLTQLNDVAQYIWGKMLGRYKAVPKVSPNKTIEGLLGGMLTTMLLAWILGPWFTPMDAFHSVLAGLLISVFGFIGDVVISGVKRDVGVKDSGSLLPGHGGILDRLDSLTYTAPLFFHYLYYVYY